MASSVKFLFSYFLVLMIFSSSLIQARESKFFSKFTHFSSIQNAKETQLSPIEAPAFSPVPTTAAPAPSPTEFSTTNGDETELFDEELDVGETYQKGSQSSNYNNNNYYYNNYKQGSESHETANQNNYNSYNNNNGYKLVSTSSSNEDGYQNYNYNTNGEGSKYNSNKNVYQNKYNGYTNNYNSNGEGSKYNSDKNVYQNKYNGYANNYNSNGYSGDNNNNNNNGFQLVSTSSSHGDPYQNYNYNTNGKRYEPVSTSSSRETSYQTNGYNGNTNSNGYEFVSTSSSYDNENLNKKNNIGDGANQRQGMSDTRFMEGGKYYHDIKNEKNYYPSNGYQNKVNYGNSGNTNEFNTMAFENQEVYEDSQEESLP